MTPFIDCFICGEGECIGNEFLDIYCNWIESRGKKDDLFHHLLSLEGIYIPTFYNYKYDTQGRICKVIINQGAPERIQPRIEKDIDLFNTSTTVFTRKSEFSKMYLLEVTRGCPRRCHFCLLSKAYKPYRQRKIDTLLKRVREGLGQRDTIGLIGASLTDYKDLDQLCQEILSLGGKISFSSLRVENFSDSLMEVLVTSGIRTVTLAPETGREKLRALIGKTEMTDDKIMDSIEKLIKWGIPSVKFYFMVGLPHETFEDVEAIVQFVKKIKHHVIQVSKGKGSLRQITVSISSFVPKPLTRFQFYPMESVELLNKKIKYLTKELRSVKGVYCTHDLPKWSFIQGLLARGDRKIGELLILAHEENGNWHRAFTKINLSPDFYLYRALNEKEIPPWVLWLRR
jgi:radical SAM superfamily enzyme YgiQ (UPF0313 family)